MATLSYHTSTFFIVLSLESKFLHFLNFRKRSLVSCRKCWNVTCNVNRVHCWKSAHRDPTGAPRCMSNRVPLSMLLFVAKDEYCIIFDFSESSIKSLEWTVLPVKKCLPIVHFGVRFDSVVTSRFCRTLMDSSWLFTLPAQPSRVVRMSLCSSSIFTSSRSQSVIVRFASTPFPLAEVPRVLSVS